MLSRGGILRRINFQIVRSLVQSSHEEQCKKHSEEGTLLLEPLKQRDIIRVRGEEVFDFLQGLTTNDMKLLGRYGNEPRSMYSMFLNKNGRVLYDSIIYSTPEPSTYLIECDSRISNELRRLLRTYRVRRKIDIDSVDRDFKPWVVFNPNTNTNNFINILKDDENICALGDPRLSDLGMRIITPTDVTWNDLSKHLRQNLLINASKTNEDDNYISQRYRNGIAEGVDDIPPGKCFPFETNADFLNGLSFNKGCYIGQELTARVHHTGVVRKRYMPLKLSVPINECTDIQTNSGAKVGKVVAHFKNRALGLVRVEPALRAETLEIDGDPCYIEKPNWWPSSITDKTKLAM